MTDLKERMTDLKERLRTTASSFGEPQRLRLDDVAERATARDRRRKLATGVTAFAIVVLSGSLVVRAFGGPDDQPRQAAANVENGPIAFSTGSFDGGSVEGFDVGIVEPDTGAVDRFPGFMTTDAWSPDGAQLAFVRDPVTTPAADMQIWVANADGTDARPLTRDSADFGPSWAPDGSELLFFRNEEGASTPALMAVTVDGSEERTISPAGGPAIYAAAWSPDGRRLMTVVEGVRPDEARYALVVMDADGTNERVVLEGSFHEAQWAQGGAEIYLISDGAVRSVNVSDGSVRDVVRSESWSEIRVDGEHRGDVDLTGPSRLVVAPDGERFLLTTSDDATRNEYLILGTPRDDGSVLMTLLADDLEWSQPDPTWSPDGTAVAFLRDGDIWTIDLSTLQETRVTSSPEQETTPAWGPASVGA